MYYEEYRLRRFHEVIGLDDYLPIIESQVTTIGLHGVIISGDYGSGKTALARLMLARLSCTGSTNLELCGDCESCKLFDSGIVPNVNHLYGSEIRSNWQYVFNKIRDYYLPHILIDNVEEANPNFLFSLHHVLDEFPQKQIVLTTSGFGTIPQPLQHRCPKIVLNEYSTDEMMILVKRVATEKGIDIQSDDSIRYLLRWTGNNPRSILNALQAIKVSGTHIDEEFINNPFIRQNLPLIRTPEKNKDYKIWNKARQRRRM
jgi:DNA polymerase III delta prime subunit